jgi:hypothetical protein
VGGRGKDDRKQNLSVLARNMDKEEVNCSVLELSLLLNMGSTVYL